MSAITFDELVQIALRPPAVTTDKECGICGAEVGQPCTLRCDHRGEQAREAVSLLLFDLPHARFEEVLNAAREREARDDETPGFFWAWWAVDTEAEERGIHPVSL